MPRQGKRYICVDLDFFEDAEDMGLTHKAQLLFLRCLTEAYKRQTDGQVTRKHLARCGGTAYGKPLQALLSVGLLVEKDRDVFWIPSWPKWYESMADVSARRAADRQRKRVKRNIPQHLYRVPD
ncbi:hypothetical protein GCM10029976_090480 [Kribbella albertanoniae]|uniref:Uncharacterized protein n=1 Tax=Kribbella albertanoniae TaxID=1266829 RepID=A0A4V2XPM4_9ACTN|nr:hypothetical protein [Kribbella albertanoniae]TDC22495.1 hypothetical protein E1261_30765 [Kribbella albertanoniae]